MVENRTKMHLGQWAPAALALEGTGQWGQQRHLLQTLA